MQHQKVTGFQVSRRLNGEGSCLVGLSRPASGGDTNGTRSLGGHESLIEDRLFARQKFSLSLDVMFDRDLQK